MQLPFFEAYPYPDIDNFSDKKSDICFSGDTLHKFIFISLQQGKIASVVFTITTTPLPLLLLLLMFA
jgi:hypothetical protein